MWDAVRTDRTVGLLRPTAGAGFAAAVRRAGYRFVDPEDAQIVTGDPTAADLAAFVAAGPLPPVVTIGSATMSDPPTQNLSTEAWWTPDVPYKSSLKGWSASELAGADADATGRRWTQPLGPVANVARTELAGGQWRRGDDGWDLALVSNAAAPTSLQRPRWNG